MEKYHQIARQSADCEIEILGQKIDHTHVGYARTNNPQQDIERQTRALADAGCGQIFQDRGFAGNAINPSLLQAISALQPGYVFRVSSLDRISRNMTIVMNVIRQISDKGARLMIGAEEETDPKIALGMVRATRKGMKKAVREQTFWYKAWRLISRR